MQILSRGFILTTVIDKQEIDRKAAEFEIHTSNVQRDYVLGRFLAALFSQSELKHIIFLKGGNALRKGYFENTRFSYDLDLGIENEIDQEFLKSEINKVCDVVHAQTGIIFNNNESSIKEKFRATSPDEPRGQLRVYEVRVYFKDFYANADHLRIKIEMDITRFDKIYLPLQDRPLIHPYSDFQELATTIRCVKLEEIVATKLKCLLQREHPPDLFDYVYSVFFSGAVELDKREVASTFLKKTIFEPSPGVVKNILLELPFQFFKDFWFKNIVCMKQSLFDVELAIARFRDSIVEMFSSFPDYGFRDVAFFPAHIRHPIMKAGREQTLLRMVYQDVERFVEPYALKYKEARGRSAREYLYVFDISGGKSGTQSIKTFVAENVQSVENTNIKFTPRVEIELAKAGDPVEDRYFGDLDKVPSPRVHIPKRIKRRSSQFVYGYSGIKYQYACSACNKKFTKKNMNSTLGQHKNKYRGDCYGRYGIYLGTKY